MIITEQQRKQKEAADLLENERIKKKQELESERERQKLKQDEFERQLKIIEQEETIRRQKIIEEQQKRHVEIEEQCRRQKELEEQRRLWEIEQTKLKELEEQQRRHRELEEQQRRLRENSNNNNQYQDQEQSRMKEVERKRLREVEEQQRIQRENEIKLADQERQRRLELEREEREKYILEKLKQEQELLEIQRRQKAIQEQREREQYEREYRERQQELVKQQQQHQQQQNQFKPPKSHREVKCVDNVSSYTTKRILEEKHKSETYEEHHRIISDHHHHHHHHIPQQQSKSCTDSGHIEKQINIKLIPVDQRKVSNNLINEQTSQTSQVVNDSRKQSEYQSNIIDHCLSSNNGHKHVLIVNSYRPSKSTVEINNCGRSQSPPIMRNNTKQKTTTTTETCADSHALTNSGSNKVNNETNLAGKYAIKHKANRYVSGAIGILETSLNGEYIILENLSSIKNVNLKGYYIHRYVPDQNINVIFKFTTDTTLCSGQKLKILARNSKSHIRSSSMHEGLNKSNLSDMSSNEKVIVANNIENWGTYSKFSVTKLINPDGVDKAVLTQSLLRLASSTNNVNVLTSATKDSTNYTNLNQQDAKEGYYYNNQQQQQHHYQSNRNKAASGSENNLQQLQIQKQPIIYSQPTCFPTTETISTTTTTTKTQTMSSQHTTTTSSTGLHETMTCAPVPTVVHVTRQF